MSSTDGPGAMVLPEERAARREDEIISDFTDELANGRR